MEPAYMYVSKAILTRNGNISAFLYYLPTYTAVHAPSLLRMQPSLGTCIGKYSLKLRFDIHTKYT